MGRDKDKGVKTIFIKAMTLLTQKIPLLRLEAKLYPVFISFLQSKDRFLKEHAFKSLGPLLFHYTNQAER